MSTVTGYKYAFKKQLPMIEKNVVGSVAVIVRMMVRGCLPVRGNQECHGSMMMNIMCVVKWNQRSMCCYIVIYTWMCKEDRMKHWLQ